MAALPRPRTYLLIAVVLSFGSACRDVSQPALDGPAYGSLFPVEHQGEWGYITRSGTLVIEPQYDRAYPFYDNRALVRQDDRFGFIDTSGSKVIPIEFSGASHFSDGVAPVQQDSLWGFVDRTGRTVIEAQFAAVPGAPPKHMSDSGGASLYSTAHPVLAPSSHPVPNYFSEGRARIRSGGQWGYVDRQGSPVIPPQFSAAAVFRDGLARVKFADDRLGYIRPDGTVVWPPDR